MAWPASQQSLADGFSLANQTASRLKQQVQTLRTLSASSPVSRGAILQMMRLLQEGIDRWQTIGALPGIVQYARDQLDDQNIDVVAEFTAMRNAAITLRDWIDTNFPRHTDGSVAVQEWSASTNYIPVDKTFSSAQLATFRTNADAFIATVG